MRLARCITQVNGSVQELRDTNERVTRASTELNRILGSCGGAESEWDKDTCGKVRQHAHDPAAEKARTIAEESSD